MAWSNARWLIGKQECAGRVDRYLSWSIKREWGARGCPASTSKDPPQKYKMLYIDVAGVCGIVVCRVVELVEQECGM